MVSYKNPFEFGKLTDFELKQEDEINFHVLDAETDNFETPTVYNNLSNPITLTYLNKDLKTNYQVRQRETSIVYDGRLLKTANVDLSKLNCSISFDISIVDLNDEEYHTKLYINIPYKTDTDSILNGSILQKIQTNGSGRFYQF